MPVEKKKKTPDVRVYTPSSQARAQLIAITTEMLRELPFPKVTARAITKRADLSLPTISRLFGSMSGLFNDVQKKLLSDTLRAHQLGLVLLRTNPDLILRTRLVVWLSLTTEHGAIFKTDFEPLIVSDLLKSNSCRGRRAMETFVRLSALTTEGAIIMQDIKPLTDSEMSDLVTLVQWTRTHLADFEKDQGWVD